MEGFRYLGDVFIGNDVQSVSLLMVLSVIVDVEVKRTVGCNNQRALHRLLIQYAHTKSADWCNALRLLDPTQTMTVTRNDAYEKNRRFPQLVENIGDRTFRG